MLGDVEGGREGSEGGEGMLAADLASEGMDRVGSDHIRQGLEEELCLHWVDS